MKTLRKWVGEKLFGSTITDWTDRFIRFLPANSSILDLGCGTCLITDTLMKKGYTVTPVDVKNKSYYPHIQPLLYNGTTLPFKSDTFDVCIIIAVLHHIKNPMITLREAIRVSQTLIILEDIITSPMQRLYTYTIDSILNKEFSGHPHSNKTDSQWKEEFKKLNLTLVKTEYTTAYAYLHNATYYLKK